MIQKLPTVPLGQGPPAYDPTESFLTDAQVEQRWNVVDGYMSELRAQGIGPPHVRLSPRIVRYKLGDILAFEQAQSFGSNAAAFEAAKPIAVEAPAVKSVTRRSPARKGPSGRDEKPETIKM